MNNVVLIGFSGAGKTTVGRRLADRLGRPFADLDDVIQASAGRSIAEIFADEGEPGFRAREARALADLLRSSGRVIALGGGAPLAEENWQRLRDGNAVVALTAEPASIISRLRGLTDRPLLNGDLDSTVPALLARRLPRYLAADLVLATDGVAQGAVVDRIASRLPDGAVDRVAIAIPGSEHEAVIGRGLPALLPAALARAGTGTAVVATDTQVAALHGRRVEAALEAASIVARRFLFPAGDQAKSMPELARFWDFLAGSGADRQASVIALGGGAIGDVAGFGAATWMRGIGWFGMPTTLLAMVDSSIGGKTAINLAAGKNLVGATHQPAGIFCDLAMLATLPEREYRAAFAEIIKTAFIADPDFVEWLGQNADALKRRDGDALRTVVIRTIRVKAAVVAADPQERDRRAVLNYGHTAGHALEIAARGRLRHGEAVAWGMHVAARLSESTGVGSTSLCRQQSELLRAFGLLSPLPSIDRSAVLKAMGHDKKSRDGRARWVLLRQIGEPEIGCAVKPDAVTAALAAVGVR